MIIEHFIHVLNYHTMSPQYIQPSYINQKLIKRKYFKNNMSLMFNNLLNLLRAKVPGHFLSCFRLEIPHFSWECYRWHHHGLHCLLNCKLSPGCPGLGKGSSPAHPGSLEQAAGLSRGGRSSHLPSPWQCLPAQATTTQLPRVLPMARGVTSPNRHKSVLLALFWICLA